MFDFSQAFGPNWLETCAQVASAVFVGVALLLDVRAREFESFMQLDARWNRLSEQCRFDMPKWNEEQVRAWGLQLLSFGELVASMVNGRRLRHWRLQLHFSEAMDLVQQWLDDDRFREEFRDPKKLPEFKLMRIRALRPRWSWREWLIDRLR